MKRKLKRSLVDLTAFILAIFYLSKNVYAGQDTILISEDGDLPQIEAVHIASYQDNVAIDSSIDPSSFVYDWFFGQIKTSQPDIWEFFDNSYEKSNAQRLEMLLEKSDEFQTHDKLPRFPFGKNNRWYRFEFETLGNVDLSEIYLIVSGWSFDTTFFAVENGKVGQILRRNITFIEDNDTIIQIGNQLAIPLSILSESEKTKELYVRVQIAGETDNISFRLSDRKSLILEGRYWLVLQSIFIGIVVSLFIYNFAIFLISRESLYFHYTMYLAAMGTYIAGQKGLWPYLLENSYRSTGVIMVSSVCMILFFLIRFMRSFLNLSDKLPKVDRVLTYFAWSVGLIVPLQFLLGYSISIIAVSLQALYVVTTILGISIVLSMRGDKYAMFFLVAFLSPLIGGIFKAGYALGFLDHSPLASHGLQFGAAFEMLLLSIAMGDKIRSLLNEVESLVRKKTKHIQSMLDNIKQGIFTIEESPDLLIHPEYSEELKAILGKDQIGSRSFREVILEKSSLDSDERAMVAEVIQTSLGEDSLTFHANAGNLMDDCVYESPEGPKVLEFDWTPITNEQDQIESFLVSCRDVTAKREADRRLQKQEEEIAIICEIVSADQRQFQSFINDALGKADTYSKCLADRQNLNTIIKQIAIDLHTAKGLSRVLGLKRLASTIHEVEEYFSSAGEGKIEPTYDGISGALEGFIDMAKFYQTIYTQRISRETDSMYLNDETLTTIISMMNKMTLDERQMSAFKDLQRLNYRSPKAGLTNLIDSLGAIATQLKKPVPKVKIDDQVMISKKLSKRINAILIHLFRNSLDHGLEDIDTRIAKGKSEQGTITCQIYLEENELRLDFYDDGGGLDTESVRKKAESLNFVSEVKRMTPEEVSQLLFEDGLSTKTKVTDISGRGVGLSAVRSCLRSSGGDITVKLGKQLDNGCYEFSFQLRLPIEDYSVLQPHAA
ncbi:MAG: hypothetical protein HRU19_17000 [Pseudobacteriovorax sp.]|nr:hypothetical protein [Pseudobacteriovorax sp.]